MKKGAILLKDPCNTCKGLQFSYKNQIFCVNCNDLSNVETTVEKILNKEDITLDSIDLITKKLQKTIISLNSEEDIDKLLKITSLISLYLDIIHKMKKHSETYK
jgi:uncharacterized Zn finger protein (UPF0148 family)